MITIPFESRLEVISDQNAADSKPAKGKGTPEGWLHVRLPDKRDEWIQAGDVISDPQPLSIPESIELAKRFLGFPVFVGRQFQLWL